MGLLDSEIVRLRMEMGYNALTTDGQPYVGVSRVFELAIQQFVITGAATTSVTPVVAADTPTVSTIVLALATGFTEGCSVIVDVDELQEQSTCRRLVGTSCSLVLQLAHPANYPVTVEGGESRVRQILQQLRMLQKPNSGRLDRAAGRAGLARVDDVYFANDKSTGGSRSVKDTLELVELYRNELESIVGVPRRNRRTGGGATRLSAH